MSKSIISILLKELNNESETTRKMLSIVPNDKYDWKPHEKSMSIKHLATHIAELPSWVGMVLNTTELDFASNPYTPEDINNTTDLMAYFEQTLADGRTQLEAGNESQLDDTWTLRNGEQIFSQSSKYDMLRITLCQITHHRAQMGVYLRLLNIPIPGSYGPSADEKGL
jgi:uncharacterized damage-inducible protein DinB